MRSFATLALTLALTGASAIAAPAGSPNTSNLEARSKSGKATFFEPGLGACGWQSGANDMIAALATSSYAGGSNCGKWITVHHNGNSAKVKVVDECPTCVSGDSVDLSPAAFSQLASKDQGMVDVTWNMA
ncbi:barwin-like endoglucanase [Jaminaea rosea]|uniref:Barwin-like endoglucanase n=1 Tax=Jaminaea rosea TaxID=1569628 RepID=A0A316UUH7_9BASI|nr:barwin-like endoglucanase [Jaminaea rosea]PWN27981.1 barwin-like endoglucanase [Jaminaea rosea]